MMDRTIRPIKQNNNTSPISLLECQLSAPITVIFPIQRIKLEMISNHGMIRGIRKIHSRIRSNRRLVKRYCSATDIIFTIRKWTITPISWMASIWKRPLETHTSCRVMR